MIKILLIATLMARRLFFFEQPVFEDFVCFPVYYREYLPQQFKTTSVTIADITIAGTTTKSAMIAQSEDGKIVMIDLNTLKTRILHQSLNRYFSSLATYKETILSVQEYPPSILQYDFNLETNKTLVLNITNDHKFEHITPSSIRLKAMALLETENKTIMLVSRNLDSLVYAYELTNDFMAPILLGQLSFPGGSDLTAMTVHGDYFWLLFGDKSRILQIKNTIVVQALELLKVDKRIDLTDEAYSDLSLADIGYTSIVFKDTHVYLGFVNSGKGDIHRFQTEDFVNCFKNGGQSAG